MSALSHVPDRTKEAARIGSPNNDKHRRAYAIYFLAALSGVSIGLNIFLGVKAFRPNLWHEVVVAMIRPPTLRPDDHTRGSNKASITVIEYSDFQCPYCARIHVSLKKMAAASEINWVYRNYPLSSIHPGAMAMAEAAECADEQGKFWEYADKLFDYQAELDPKVPLVTTLINLGEAIGLDGQRFKVCLSNNRFDARIRTQIIEANSLRIDATPTIFVNGKRHIGSLPLDQLEQLVSSQKN